MKQTFLACMLALLALVQLPARGAGLSLAGAGSSKSRLVEAFRPRPDGGLLAAQDTSRLGSAREPRLAMASIRMRAVQQFEMLRAVQPDSGPVAYLNEAGEFDPEAAALPAALAIALRRPAAPLGRRNFHTRPVRTGRFATHREAVEILTCTYAGPLVLAQLPATAAAPAQLLAGPGYDQAVALRPLALTQEAVLRLCGDRAPQVLAYARLYNLHFQQADEVARLFDYYNRIAVVK